MLQARSTGQPVEIKEAGPDPQLTALSAKFDDMDQTLRSLNGEIETLTHDIDQAHKEADDAKAQAAGLSDRLDGGWRRKSPGRLPRHRPRRRPMRAAPSAAQASPPPGGGDPKPSPTPMRAS